VITVLKHGLASAARSNEEIKVRGTVAEILQDVMQRGDSAVRRYSRKFDSWDPPQFRLAQSDILRCMEALPHQVLEDIQFAQSQIRNFAQRQRESLHDLEVETLPGVVLGHKNIPVGSVGCYIPGGRYPLVASAHMGVLTAKVAGVQRVIAAAPPAAGAAPAEPRRARGAAA